MDESKGESSMTTPVNVFTPAAGMDGAAAMLPAVMAGMSNHGATGGAIGGGLGAGLVGGLLGGLLFGRGGVGFNGGMGEGCVTPTQLATSVNSVIDNSNITATLEGIADIKAAVPLAESQVQLALAGAQADINANINSSLQVAIGGQANINKNINDAIASSLASQNSINMNVMTSSAAVLAGIQNSKFELAQVVRDDGDKTRALLIEQNTTTLNRQLAVAESALLEERTRGRSRETEINVTQTVNQNQLQLQAQAQQQQQLILLSQIASGLANVAQVAHATNSNVIAGNTGAVTTGTQTANPVNVNA